MIFARGLAPSEGPVLLPDGSWVICEMSPETGGVTRVSADGWEHRLIARTGRPNGLAMDANMNIWVAETDPPALVRVTLDGRSEVVLTERNGEPFLFPNDLCFGPDGHLYLTDSGILFKEFVPGGRIRPDYLTCPVDGRLYRIDTRARRIWKLESGGRFTNGVAFGPDNALYTTETLTGNIYRYEWKDGRLGPRDVHGHVLKKRPEEYESIAGPDGMAFGTNGHLYVAVLGQGDVTVLGRKGEVITRIPTQSPMPTNVAFGPKGSRKIYVTEMARGEMEVFDADTDGLPLWPGPKS